jgi:hypothetical protein
VLKNVMKKLDVYRQILRDVIHDDTALEDALLYIVVLHTHSITLRPGVTVEDGPPNAGGHGIVLAPLTRNHLAELVSSLWESRDQRANPGFWYSAYCRLTPYELFEDLPDSMRDSATAAKRTIETHDLVEKLVQE